MADDLSLRFARAIRALRPDVTISAAADDRLIVQSPRARLEAALRPLRAVLHLGPTVVEQYAERFCAQLASLEASDAPHPGQLFPALRSTGQVAQLEAAFRANGAAVGVPSWALHGELRWALVLMASPESVQTASSGHLTQLGLGPEAAFALATRNLSAAPPKLELQQSDRVWVVLGLLAASALLEPGLWTEANRTVGGGLLALPVNRDVVVLGSARSQGVASDMLARAQQLSGIVPLPLPPTVLRWTPQGFEPGVANA
jgi:hypothetical protein